MVPSTKNFKKIAESQKAKKRKKEYKSPGSGYPHLGEMPAIDTLSPVSKPKKVKK